MNKIKQRLFYMEIAKKLKVGDILKKYDDEDFEIEKINKCTKETCYFSRRYGSCTRLSLNNGNCICSDRFFTHINGVPIYEEDCF